MEELARVFLLGGLSKSVRYDDETTIERVISVVLRGIGISQVAFAHFALRLVTGPTPLTAGTGESIWLHPHLKICRISKMFSHQLPIGVNDEIKMELRMRFMPHSVYELQVTDYRAFEYLHEQVVEQFFNQIAWRTSTDITLEVAALKVCRDIGKEAPNLDDIDIDACIQSLIPNVLHQGKSGMIKKQFVMFIRKSSLLADNESIIRSLALLLDIVKFDVEIFKACLGDNGWTNPCELLIGPHASLSYRLNDNCETSKLLELRCISQIRLRGIESSDKTVIHLKLSGAAQPVFITVSSKHLAHSLAHLLDGYQMMYNQRGSVFENQEDRSKLTRQLSANIADQNIRLRREQVTLKELIGGGQFGNVYKAIYYDEEKDMEVNVAVKVCKNDPEPSDTQLILQESSVMKNIRHAHIISFIGICVEQPMWMVLELAQLGELREYLQNESDCLQMDELLMFASQICDALVYLHSSRFVHRDIAARNVLVCSKDCVKLADFGLSRALDYDAVYTASRGKLPIKWLAPESVNYRQFSMASDVWMFGVCLWEILSLGVKPWTGITNSDVISHIEEGQRLACPLKCPRMLYEYMRGRMWSIEPQKRPNMEHVMKTIDFVRAQIAQGVPMDEIVVCKPNAGVIVAEMSHLPSIALKIAIEEQRRQAEEDDKWLEDEDEHDDEMDIQRQIETAVDGVCEAVATLQNTFNNRTKNEEFVMNVKSVTNNLRQMLTLTAEFLTSTECRPEIEVTKTLIANDMKQMSRVMARLQANKDTEVFNSLRRDVIRICVELSVNCRTLQTQLSTSDQCEFEAVLSNC